MLLFRDTWPSWTCDTHSPRTLWSSGFLSRNSRISIKLWMYLRQKPERIICSSTPSHAWIQLPGRNSWIYDCDLLCDIWVKALPHTEESRSSWKHAHVTWWESRLKFRRRQAPPPPLRGNGSTPESVIMSQWENNQADQPPACSWSRQDIRFDV